MFSLTRTRINRKLCACIYLVTPAKNAIFPPPRVSQGRVASARYHFVRERSRRSLNSRYFFETHPSEKPGSTCCALRARHRPAEVPICSGRREENAQMSEPGDDGRKKKISICGRGVEELGRGRGSKGERRKGGKKSDMYIYAKEQKKGRRKRASKRNASSGSYWTPRDRLPSRKSSLKGESSATGSEGRGEIIKAGPRGKRALTRERIAGRRGNGKQAGVAGRMAA